MKLYKRMARIYTYCDGGMGFRPDIHVLTDWMNEDDPEIEKLRKEYEKEYEISWAEVCIEYRLVFVREE